MRFFFKEAVFFLHKNTWFRNKKRSLHGVELWGPENTLPKTNIAPENRPSQKESSLATVFFRGEVMLVSGSVNGRKSNGFAWYIGEITDPTYDGCYNSPHLQLVIFCPPCRVDRLDFSTAKTPGRYGGKWHIQHEVRDEWWPHCFLGKKNICHIWKKPWSGVEPVYVERTYVPLV